MRSVTKVLGNGVALMACAVLFAGCGDEEETEAATAPVFEIDGLLKECVMSDTSEDRFEGAFLNRLAIPVSDANLDLEKVTVTIGGALHEMSWAVRNEDGSPGATLSGTPAELNAQLKSGEIAGTVHLFERGEDDDPIRCEAGTPIVFRATDAAGNITVEEASLP